MSIKKRIEQLEQLQSVNQDIRVARFCVIPETGPDGVVRTKEADGYVCDGTTIVRKPNESTKSLQARAVSSVIWEKGASMKNFYPLNA